MNIGSKDMLTLHNNNKNTLTNDAVPSSNDVHELDLVKTEPLLSCLPNLSVKRDNSLSLLIDDECSMETTSDADSSFSNSSTTPSVNILNDFGDLQTIFDQDDISTTTTTKAPVTTIYTNTATAVSKDELDDLLADPENFVRTIPDAEIDCVLNEIDSIFLEDILHSSSTATGTTKNVNVSMSETDPLDSMFTPLPSNVSNTFVMV